MHLCEVGQPDQPAYRGTACLKRKQQNFMSLVRHPGFYAEVTCSRTHPLIVLVFRCSAVIVLFVTLLWFYAADLSPSPSPITANLMVFQGKAVRYDHAAILIKNYIYLLCSLENIIGIEPSVSCT